MKTLFLTLLSAATFTITQTVVVVGTSEAVTLNVNR